MEQTVLLRECNTAEASLFGCQPEKTLKGLNLYRHVDGPFLRLHFLK